MTLLAVVVAETCAVLVLRVSVGNVRDLPPRTAFGAYALVTVFAMFVIVLVELLARPRARRPVLHIPHPIRGTRRLGGRAVRYAKVSVIAVRHGLFRSGGEDVEVKGSRLGHSLSLMFEDAGGLFVKLGQAMAVQPHLVTRAVAAELARLQDRAAPADATAARAVIEEELGPPEDIFAELSSVPIGSASIATMYVPRLRNGREVVVKVQRPGVRESIEQDLDILIRLTDRLDRRTTWARSLGLRELVAGFAEHTREELDFHAEASHMDNFRRSLQDTDRIGAPELVEEFSTSRVLVEELVAGRSVAAPGVLDGLDADGRRALADGLLSLTMRQMLAGEPFHADPHPGNVFLHPDGRLMLIDFGSVGRLDRFERLGLIDLMRGLQAEDPSLLREAALRIGTHATRIDEEALDRELARLLSGATRPDGTVNPDIFGDALFVFREFGILLPRSTTTLFRTLVTLLGTCRSSRPATTSERRPVDSGATWSPSRSPRRPPGARPPGGDQRRSGPGPPPPRDGRAGASASSRRAPHAREPPVRNGGRPRGARDGEPRRDRVGRIGARPVVFRPSHGASSSGSGRSEPSEPPWRYRAVLLRSLAAPARRSDPSRS